MRVVGVVGTFGALGLFGCDTDVGSPFTAVSAGGTEAATTEGGTTGSATSGISGMTGITDTPQTSGSTSSSTGSDSSSTSGTVDPTEDETTGGPNMDETTAADPCMPNPCTAPEVCVEGRCSGPAAPQPGEVVFTELQPNPDAVPDEQGEWLELHNTADAAVELNGCELVDQDTDSHVITTSTLIEPGGYAVLGRADGANGGVALDYTYGNDVTLANGEDEIALRCGGTLIDEVVYSGSWPFTAGTSAQLTPGAEANNDDPNQWCGSGASYGDGDLGSPGAANLGC